MEECLSIERYSSIKYLSVDELPRNARICIYGAGGRGAEIRRLITGSRKDVSVVYFADSFKRGEFEGLRIINIEDIDSKRNEYDLILIASYFWMEIAHTLMEQKIDRLAVAVTPHSTGTIKTAFVVDEYEFMYIMIPKAACTSIRQSICKALDIELTMRSVDLLDEAYGNYYKFTFVRNPWDRIVSCYENKFSDQEIYSKCIGNLIGVEKVSFNAFLAFLRYNPDEMADDHWQSQHTLILDNELNNHLNFIGRFENLSGDFVEVCKCIGIKAKLLHLNPSPHRLGSYQCYYNDYTKSIVSERYRDDIELFGYSF